MFHSKIFELWIVRKERSRPVTYILDDVKETIVTDNTYKAIPYNVLKTYFLPKGWF